VAPPKWNEIMATLVARRELTEDQMRAALEEMMQGKCGEAETAAFLVGLRMKGETCQEIAAAARVLRRHMIRWDPGGAVLDTCGTGGDGSGTFNISTAAALVVAGAGVKVVKHGNRSMSSKSGSADVLAALGVTSDGSPDLARRQLENAGFAFCFAPHFHPALRHTAQVRRKLGIPTIFNCLGPLANPAGATHQLLGVSRPELGETMAGALAQLGDVRALVVCGKDGLDEVSLSGPTLVREVRGGEVREFEWTRATFGLEGATVKELAASDAKESAAIIERLLEGQDGPAARMTLANAAAALLLAGKAGTPLEGVALARDAISSGKARKVLERLRELAKRSEETLP
jgi:anthranilate phosphoribosyltransferase